jgi:hypothetical protein
LTENEIKFSGEQKNWKVRRELLREVNIECATLEITQYELADIVWKAYVHTKQVESVAKARVEAKQEDDEKTKTRKYLHKLLDVCFQQGEQSLRRYQS